MDQPPPSVLIVDDEPLARTRLKALCERIRLFGEIALANSGRQAVEKIRLKQPDILLLDVDMPDFSGLKVAEFCQALGHMPEIIFTTAHSTYAVQAFRLEATDYLLKPVKELLLREAVERAIANRARAVNNGEADAVGRLWVQDGAGALQLMVSDIEWVEAERDYMRLYLPDRSFLVHQSMRSLERLLPDELFVRVHRSAIVRRDCIAEVRRKGRKRYVILQDGKQLPIGPRYAERIAGSGQAGRLGGSRTVTE
ncbi:LytR/AlgR family response regulator transcription factor [Sphingorhabdus sp. SMR4y]|uniref:LytR/AlgR family response regulator transcription factor n=1 Tax=Sphingorhabdus sp. SMR4y TaxID=2584094 RepID=UPI000B5CE0D1|nr:LytTR family DNA-binding domain-containing protein [Sphingorhabdus sp. SMR4y]ASK89745.1 two-component system response regulator [Sphingorhabdus sp. SMR4y]